MKGLTDTQHRVLAFVNGYTNENGYPPAIRELRDFLDTSTIRTAEQHINALIEKGMLIRDGRGGRALGVTEKGREAVTPLYFKYEEGTFVQIGVS